MEPETWSARRGALAVLDLKEEHSHEDDHDVAETEAKLHKHLRRGKSIAYYRNEDLGHPMIGHVVAFTYGTPEAQFEGEPPKQCPDGLMPGVTGGINWRYQLVAVTKALPVISDPVGV